MEKKQKEKSISKNQQRSRSNSKDKQQSKNNNRMMMSDGCKNKIGVGRKTHEGIQGDRKFKQL